VKAVLFDLDDTLYPERTFVESGFRAVSRFLATRHDLQEDRVAARMLEILDAEGRGKVFDRVLEEAGLLSEWRVRLLLHVYRTHRPTISLFEDVVPSLTKLRERGVWLGIVTDGMASVQRRKMSALGIERYVDVVVCSDELGPEGWKPSPVAFQAALELLEIAPEEAAYVGDNVLKDFAGPNRLGMLSVVIRRPGVMAHAGEKAPGAEYVPQVTVSGLAPLVAEVDRRRRSA
jgi:putative hydrolase of the HAD superfamily